MWYVRLLSAFFFVTWLTASPSAQTIATNGRDAKALNILAQMQSATGWSRAMTPSDVLATATLTLGGVDGTSVAKRVTFKARGLTQLRWEYSDTPGQVTVADLGAGVAVGPNGMALPVQSAQPWQFPFLGRLLEFDDHQIQVEYLGTEMLAGPVHKIRFHRLPSAADARPDEVEAGSTITVWISATSFLPVQVEYLSPCITNGLAFIQHVRRYSNYRLVQGVQVPFHQEEWFDGEPAYTLDFTGVSFNVGLSPGDFPISSLAGGRR